MWDSWSSLETLDQNRRKMEGFRHYQIATTFLSKQLLWISIGTFFVGIVITSKEVGRDYSVVICELNVIYVEWTHEFLINFFVISICCCAIKQECLIRNCTLTVDDSKNSESWIYWMLISRDAPNLRKDLDLASNPEDLELGLSLLVGFGYRFGFGGLSL